LHIAREIRRLFSLSRVYFVVATTPPHKDSETLIPFAHRFAMVALATSRVAAFVPSLVEMEPLASPFSVDTMDKLRRRFPEPRAVLYFIAGGDSLPEVKSWRESEKLLSRYNFVFALRPGSSDSDPAELLGCGSERLRDFTGLSPGQVRLRIGGEDPKEPRIYVVDVNAPEISATRIRKLVGSGRPIGGLVPESVRQYIDKLHLYGAR